MDEERSAAMPDHFDYVLGQLEGFPHTKQSTVTDVPPLGVGGSRTFIVQTFRVKDHGDTVFLQAVGAKDMVLRLVIPAKISTLIAKQREALNARSRRVGARAAAATRKKLGIKPGFLKGKGSK